MKLLICTQAVDLDDPVLGFFHRWIMEFAKQCDTVHVICLREGRHELPKNVFVHSLGKEKRPSRIGYILNFYRYAWKYRREYDGVFVHMNPEYLCLGGPLWRLWGKRTGLWYVHWSVTVRLRIATFFANAVFTATKGSFLLRTRKLQVLGHGIDTSWFVPPSTPPRPDSILFLARLDATKRADVFVRALGTLHEEGTPFSADIVGSPTEPSSKYAHDVRNLASPLALEGVITMHEAVPHEKARGLFASHAIFCNLSPQGHFDKTILEAASSGMVVVATNDAVRGILPDDLIPTVDDPVSTANAIRSALARTPAQRTQLAQRSREWVEREHSLSALIGKIDHILFNA